MSQQYKVLIDCGKLCMSRWVGVPILRRDVDLVSRENLANHWSIYSGHDTLLCPAIEVNWNIMINGRNGDSYSQRLSRDENTGAWSECHRVSIAGVVGQLAVRKVVT